MDELKRLFEIKQRAELYLDGLAAMNIYGRTTEDRIALDLNYEQASHSAAIASDTYLAALRAFPVLPTTTDEP